MRDDAIANAIAGPSSAIWCTTVHVRCESGPACKRPQARPARLAGPQPFDIRTELTPNRRSDIGTRTMRRLLLASPAFLLCMPPAVAAQQAGITLASEQATVVLSPRDTSVSASVLVTLDGVAPAEVTLRAVPLVQGQSYGFIQFPGNAGHDTIRLDSGSLICGHQPSCSVSYIVTGADTAGPYNGTIEAWRAGSKVAAAPISVVRIASGFHPVITGDQIHDGRISVDLDGSVPKTFVVTIQNPAGSSPQQFDLLACPKAPSCPSSGPPGPPEPKMLGFRPATFRLEPGATQSVSVTVRECPSLGTCAATMLLRNHASGEAMETVISVNQYQSVPWRQTGLLIAALLGSVVSVVLNNLFPTTRVKHAAREAIRRMEGQLRECPNAGNGLLDMLHAEAARLTLVLRSVSFTSSTKQADLQDIQQGTASLGQITASAHRLSLLRTEADAAVMPLGAHGAIRSKLLDAEEALSVPDIGSAAAHLDEAQAQIVLARDDAQQTALKQVLQQGIPRLLQERGKRPRLAEDAPADAPLPPLQQPTWRDPLVHHLVEQIDEDARSLDSLVARDLLDIECDFYLTDVWTEYVERKMVELNREGVPVQPADETRRQEWSRLFDCLLKCLRGCPNADQTRLLIDLIRHDTTLDDIIRALERGDGGIETSTQPGFLDPVDVAFVLTDPVLGNIAAVRRLLDYEWSFGDGSTMPPSVDHCRHYFRPPRRFPGKAHEKTYTISVTVRVPFADATPVTFTRHVTPKWARRFSVSAITNWVGFGTSAAIAVVTALARNTPPAFQASSPGPTT